MNRISKEQKITPEILVEGEFTPEDIQITRKPSNRVIDEKFESQIEPLWVRIKRVAEIKGKKCYNGTLYRLNNLKLTTSSDIELKSRERERVGKITQRYI